MAVKYTAPSVVIDKTSSYSILIDEAGSGIIYYGFAKPGAKPGDASWRIMRESSSGNTTSFLYANGSDSMSNVWDSRGTYTYA